MHQEGRKERRKKRKTEKNREKTKKQKKRKKRKGNACHDETFPDFQGNFHMPYSTKSCEKVTNHRR